jgi:hypothetical protein
MKNQNTSPKSEVKLVKHTFTIEERDQIGGELAQALASLRGVNDEFDQVKAEYKSRITSAETKINSLETARINGFEMRQTRCVALYFPERREKEYYLEEDTERKKPVLVERMTAEDFAIELLQAESKFDDRIELPLFQSVNDNFGFLIVGRLDKRWYSALRARVGAKQIEERLDSEQQSFKNRFDAVSRALKRWNEWLVQELGKDTAEGFKDGVNKIITSQKEK